MLCICQYNPIFFEGSIFILNDSLLGILVANIVNFCMCNILHPHWLLILVERINFVLVINLVFLVWWILYLLLVEKEERKKENDEKIDWHSNSSRFLRLEFFSIPIFLMKRYLFSYSWLFHDICDASTNLFSHVLLNLRKLDNKWNPQRRPRYNRELTIRVRRICKSMFLLYLLFEVWCSRRKYPLIFEKLVLPGTISFICQVL